MLTKVMLVKMMVNSRQAKRLEKEGIPMINRRDQEELDIERFNEARKKGINPYTNSLHPSSGRLILKSNGGSVSISSFIGSLNFMEGYETIAFRYYEHPNKKYMYIIELVLEKKDSLSHCRLPTIINEFVESSWRALEIYDNGPEKPITLNLAGRLPYDDSALELKIENETSIKLDAPTPLPGQVL